MSLIEKILKDPMHKKLSSCLSKEEKEHLDNSIKDMLKGAELLYLQITDMTSTDSGRSELAEIFESVIKETGSENVNEK